MTLERYKQAAKQNETLYYLTAYTSPSFARTFDVPRTQINLGPFLRLSTVKRKAAKMRKERTIYLDKNGNEVDAGPTYSDVSWREVKPNVYPST